MVICSAIGTESSSRRNPSAKRPIGSHRTLERRGGTWAEWHAACQGGDPAGCNFEWAGPLTEAVLLGNIAVRAGKRLEWDSRQLKFTNANDANKFVSEPYQNGWSLETI